MPLFPNFKPIELNDYSSIGDILWKYQPQISDLTFTNLFMWRKLYRYQWCLFQNWLFLIAQDESGYYALEPVGPPPRLKAVSTLFEWLLETNRSGARIERSDSKLIDEISQSNRFLYEPQREHYDYLYATRDLISLSGSQFHAKQNHLARFLKSNSILYKPITPEIVTSCIEMATRWCKEKHCKKDQHMCYEWIAIHDALTFFDELKLQGAAIYVNGKLEAFTIGELLNHNTAVVHIEKANSKIHGIYAAINQMFCEQELNNTTFINREQDLGDSGLRKAKLSYHPLKLIEKSRISSLIHK